LSQASPGSIAACSGGQWTYNGDLDLTGYSLNIQQDTLIINGAFTSGTTLAMSISPGNASGSAMLILEGSGANFYSKGNIQITLLTAPVGTYGIIYTKFPPNKWVPPKFTSILPTLPSDYALCRDLSTPSFSEFADCCFTVNFTITQDPSVSCLTGRGPRGWVIVIEALMAVHAICLLVFCLVTCKKESWKEKVWEVD